MKRRGRDSEWESSASSSNRRSKSLKRKNPLASAASSPHPSASPPPGTPSPEDLVLARYKLWRRYVPLLYDVASTRLLPWPSTTIELWDCSRSEQNRALWSEVLRAVASRDPQADAEETALGPFDRVAVTCASSGEEGESSLNLSLLSVPPPRNHADPADFSDPSPPAGRSAREAVSLRAGLRVDVKRELTNGRCMPQQPTIVACATVSGSVDLCTFDARSGQEFDPVNLRPPREGAGPEREGAVTVDALEWSKARKGLLYAVNAKAHKVSMWGDVMERPDHAEEINLGATTINDLDAHPLEVARFVVATEKGSVLLVDARIGGQASVTMELEKVHGEGVGANCVSLRPGSTYLATGSGTGSTIPVVRLWDERKAGSECVQEYSHGSSSKHLGLNGEVTRLRWGPSPSDDPVGTNGLLAAASGDACVRIWSADGVKRESAHESNEIDMSNHEGEENRAANLVFLHGGHTDAVTDLAWDPNATNLLCSVAEDNIVQTWRPNCLV